MINIKRMLIMAAAYLLGNGKLFYQLIKGNCFKTFVHILLMEINFGRAPKFFLRVTFGDYWIC